MSSFNTQSPVHSKIFSLLKRRRAQRITPWLPARPHLNRGGSPRRSKHIHWIFGAAILALCVGSLTAVPQAEGKAAGKRFVFLLSTDATPSRQPTVEEIALGIPANSLAYDAALIDLSTGNVIGTATDFIVVQEAEVQNDPTTPLSNGLHARVLGSAIFRVRNSGWLVTQGLTTVQPVLQDSAGFTHTTLALEAPGNSVLGGTKRFAGATGTATLNGAVDLTAFPAEAGFRCIFVITLD